MQYKHNVTVENYSEKPRLALKHILIITMVSLQLLVIFCRNENKKRNRNNQNSENSHAPVV